MNSIRAVLIRYPEQFRTLPWPRLLSLWRDWSVWQKFRPKALELGTGIVTEQSSHSGEDTARLLQDLLGEKGVKLFAMIDHSDKANRGTDGRHAPGAAKSLHMQMALWAKPYMDALKATNTW